MRDIRLFPFADSSVWVLPRGDRATMQHRDDPMTANLIDPRVGIWANQSTYSHPISQAKYSDPVATMKDIVYSARSAAYRIPANAEIAAGTDRHMHIITPDGKYVHEAFGVVRVDEKNYTCKRHHKVSLNGSGLGPQNGVRAYGGSAIAGLIRSWEVQNMCIEHPTAWALTSSQLLCTGGDWGYDSRGYGKSLGYVDPATEQDYDSKHTYEGLVPMGAYFSIENDAVLSGLSVAGRMLAESVRDRGAYVVDRSSVMTCYIEPSAPAWFRVQLLPDLPRIRSMFRIVTNNTPETPNGAGLRRAYVDIGPLW